MAPSTPPPPSSVELAALTIASTRCAVMSPRTMVSLTRCDLPRLLASRFCRQSPFPRVRAWQYELPHSEADHEICRYRRGGRHDRRAAPVLLETGPGSCRASQRDAARPGVFNRGRAQLHRRTSSSSVCLARSGQWTPPHEPSTPPERAPPRELAPSRALGTRWLVLLHCGSP